MGAGRGGSPVREVDVCGPDLGDLEGGIDDVVGEALKLRCAFGWYELVG